MAVDERHNAFVLAPISETISNTLADDYAACRAIMRAASKNYTFASRFLPADRLHHVEALYAVMRVGDDRVDVSHEGFGSPLAAIEDWRDSYWRAFQTGDSHYPVLRAYLHTCHAFDIPPHVLDPYFRAMIEDLDITRFPTFADLLHYMDGSALTVGRAMCYLLGATTPRVADAFGPADSLSIAMQLSNFWRDIGEDWRRGRVYLPLEDMDRFGVTEDDIANGRVTPQFTELLEFEIERTAKYYDHARQGVGLLASGRWGVMASIEIYGSILTEIRRNRYDVYRRRASASTTRKAGLALLAGLRTVALTFSE